MPSHGQTGVPYHIILDSKHRDLTPSPPAPAILLDKRRYAMKRHGKLLAVMTISAIEGRSR